MVIVKEDTNIAEDDMLGFSAINVFSGSAVNIDLHEEIHRVPINKWLDDAVMLHLEDRIDPGVPIPCSSRQICTAIHA